MHGRHRAPVDLRATSAEASLRVPFSVVDAGMVLLAFFVGQLIVGFVGGLLIVALGGSFDSTTLMILAIASTITGLLTGLLWLVLRRRLTWHLFGPGRHGTGAIAAGLGVGVVGTIGAYAVNMLLALLVEPDGQVHQQVLEEALRGGTSLVAAAVVAVVAAPIAEEIVFRGVLFQALRRRTGLWPAAMVSSLVFTFIHVEIVFSQPLALVGLFGLGVLFAWSFHRTGSLVVPILGHAVFNAFSVTLAVLADRMGLMIPG